jgi:hypothetical protein
VQYRFHDLRHLHASELLRHGVHPKVVQERLGHASITMTLDTYSHLIPSMQRDAISAIRLFAERGRSGNQKLTPPEEHGQDERCREPGEGSLGTRGQCRTNGHEDSRDIKVRERPFLVDSRSFVWRD